MAQACAACSAPFRRDSLERIRRWYEVQATEEHRRFPSGRTTKKKIPGHQLSVCLVAAARKDADGLRAAGADATTDDRMQVLVEADLDRGQEIVAAAQREAGAGNGGVAAGKLRQDGLRRKRELLWLVECGGNLDTRDGAAGQSEVGVGCQTGAGAMGRPLVREEAGVGVDVAVSRGIRGTGCV